MVCESPSPMATPEPDILHRKAHHVMIVRMIWPDHRRDTTIVGNGHAGDAFWLECRLAEADALVLSHATPERRAELARDISDIIAVARARIASFDRERAEDDTDEWMPDEGKWRRYGGAADPWICFLVSRDGAVIEAHPWHYPFSGLWNAYSPFRAIPETVMASLADLRALPTPDDAP
jgi:hypothetical protein